MRPLDPPEPRRILVRATNWVGDAVMTLPALRALARARPQAAIEVLARPQVAPIYAAQPMVSRVLPYDPRTYAGLGGRLRLARELKSVGYDWAVLLQNAFEAAFLAWRAGIGTRLGYASDARRPLLSHAVARAPRVLRVHQTSYYLNLLHAAGLLAQAPPPGGVRPDLVLDPRDQAWAAGYLRLLGLEGARLLGLAPGAAYGPAKCWPAERYAQAARDLAADGYGAVLLFGGPGEAAATARVAAGLAGLKVLDLAGATSLGQALALLEFLGLFLTNDSGLMHAAAALGVPTLAVFGSTDPVTTAPLGPRVALVRKPQDCSPCLKTHCPTDLRCFTSISPQEVARAARELLASGAGEGRS